MTSRTAHKYVYIVQLVLVLRTSWPVFGCKLQQVATVHVSKQVYTNQVNNAHLHMYACMSAKTKYYYCLIVCYLNKFFKVGVSIKSIQIVNHHIVTKDVLMLYKDVLLFNKISNISFHYLPPQERAPPSVCEQT